MLPVLRSVSILAPKRWQQGDPFMNRTNTSSNFRISFDNLFATEKLDQRQGA